MDRRKFLSGQHRRSGRNALGGERGRRVVDLNQCFLRGSRVTNLEHGAKRFRARLHDGTDPLKTCLRMFTLAKRGGSKSNFSPEVCINPNR